MATGSHECVAVTPYVVPAAGKRLVIEYALGDACIEAVYNVAAKLTLGAKSPQLVLGPGRTWMQWTCRDVSQQMLGYADAGTSVSLWFGIDVYHTPSYGGTGAPISIIISGRLVPAP